MSGTYHEGERAVQQRAGVRAMSERVAGGIHDAIPEAAGAFLAERRFIVAGWADRDGRVWASPLWGPPGFARADGEHAARIDAAPAAPGDPLPARLEKVEAEGGTLAMGFLALDAATQRRMRLNGAAWAVPSERGGPSLRVAAGQVYANCPKYIQKRTPEEPTAVGAAALLPARRSDRLDAGQRARIAAVDTFFIATAHPEAGADASHRGGSPGFVRVWEDGRTLAWADYSGNAMFNTLGNIAATGRAGLLFLDEETGDVLQLTGRAEVLWGTEAVAAAGAADGEARAVRFTVEDSVESPGAFPLRARLTEYSRFNPV
jgi:predicted pyridoxine 5'-phosphate oxidase superfamily flavin-nucleotide-binding protein